MRHRRPRSGPEFCRRFLFGEKTQEDMGEFLGVTRRAIAGREAVGDFSKSMERTVRARVHAGDNVIPFEEWMLHRAPDDEEWERFKVLAVAQAEERVE